MSKEITRIPKLTRAERDAGTFPADFLILNTTNHQLEVFSGTRWEPQLGFGVKTVAVAVASVEIDDTYIGVSPPAGPPDTEITFPIGVEGKRFVVKDEAGVAGSPGRNIISKATAPDLFENGTGQDAISTNFGFRMYVYRGGIWYTIARA